MPDLSADAVVTWLIETEPVIAAEIAAAPPSMEEHEIVLPVVLQLGQRLDEKFTASADELRQWLRQESTHADTLITLAQIGRGRRLRLMHWLSAISEGDEFPASLLENNESDEGMFLRSEIRNLHRKALLERMFSPQRIAALLAACQEIA
jgi:hypothetical protein